MLRICLTSLLLLCALVPQLQAVPIEGLYDAEVAVESRSDAALKSASRDGLAEVLVRVSGRAEVLQDPGVVEALGKPQTYLRRYSFDAVQGEEGSSQLMVGLEFEGALVERLLRQQGLPIWSANRPSVLVWLAVERGREKRFVSPDSEPEIVEMISQEAERRGLVLRWPLMDLEDNIALQTDDLWRMDIVALRSAAARYGSDGLLFGRATELSTGQWLGQWQLSLDQQHWSFEGERAEPTSYWPAGVASSADLLAEQYAVVPVAIAEEGITLSLEGIKGFSDYSRVLRYLSGLSAVRLVTPQHIERERMVVRLAADGSLEQLEQAFKLDNRVMPAADREEGYDLYYRWLESVQSNVSKASISTSTPSVTE